MGGFIFGDNGGKGHFGQLTFDKVGGDQSIGKQRDNSAVLLMSDVEGRPRIRMQVAPDGTPKLEFLDEVGRVVSSLPGALGAPRP